MAKAYNYRGEGRKVDLTGDDTTDIEKLTGALWDDDPEFDRRQRMLPPRRCPPWMKRSARMTKKFREAVETHNTPIFRQMLESEQQGVHDVLRMLEEGKLESIEDVPEEFIIKTLALKMADTRRPTVQLKAAQLMAQAKGMLTQGKGTSVEDVEAIVQAQIDEAESLSDERAEKRQAQMRAVKKEG